MQDATFQMTPFNIEHLGLIDTYLRAAYSLPANCGLMASGKGLITIKTNGDGVWQCSAKDYNTIQKALTKGISSYGA